MSSIPTTFVLYVARDLRFSWVHSDLDFSGRDTVGIVFSEDSGKETRCHRLTPKILDDITREMLRYEDDYFAGTVSEVRYEKAAKRWLALKAEVDNATSGADATSSADGCTASVFAVKK